MKKIILTGGTGAIGKRLSKRLMDRGDEVVLFTRDIESAKKNVPGAAKYVRWNYSNDDWFGEVENAAAVIHLAGENVFSARWTERQKKKIYESRIKSTSKLIEAIKKAKVKPESFIAASAVGYYGNSVHPVDEDSNPGTDFLARVTKAWEDESKNIETIGVRRVNIRTGIVLDRASGALARLIIPFKLFLGGPLGSGKQWFPWIHIDDLIEIYLLSIDSKKISGVMNAVSPGIVSMDRFCKTLGKEMHRPAAMKVPEFILKLFLGERADVLLEGACVIPQKTVETGFCFKHGDLKEALRDLLKN